MTHTFKTVAIVGLMLSTAFFVGEGTGETFGVLQDSDTFSDRIPTPGICDWNETGSFQNVFANGGCNLNIDNLSQVADTVKITRYPLAQTQTEFEQQASATDSLQYLEDGNQLGIYFTAEDSTNKFSYYSENFYSQSAPINVEYRYEEISSPTSANLILWDEANNNEEDSVTLTPGDEANDFFQNKTLNATTDGQFSLRIEFTGATIDEQRVYSLEAYQSSDDLDNISTGVYHTDFLYESDNTFIDRFDIKGNDIQRSMENKKQYANVIVQGYNNGDIVEARNLEATNRETTYQDFYPDQTIRQFRFRVYMLSETGSSPEFEYMSVSGTQADRVASPAVSNLFRILFTLLFIGLALVYGASSLRGR